jgi:hypothetical protein
VNTVDSQDQSIGSHGSAFASLERPSPSRHPNSANSLGGADDEIGHNMRYLSKSRSISDDIKSYDPATHPNELFTPPKAGGVPNSSNDYNMNPIAEARNENNEEDDDDGEDDDQEDDSTVKKADQVKDDLVAELDSYPLKSLGHYALEYLNRPQVLASYTSILAFQSSLTIFFLHVVGKDQEDVEHFEEWPANHQTWTKWQAEAEIVVL